MNKMASILLTIAVQLTITGIIFFSFLLDPLIGVWIVGIYFFVIVSFLTYRFFLHEASTEV